MIILVRTYEYKSPWKGNPGKQTGKRGGKKNFSCNLNYLLAFNGNFLLLHLLYVLMLDQYPMMLFVYFDIQ